ncbi:MAG: PepSY domain-containing protein [Paracoccaceae bacterium]
MKLLSTTALALLFTGAAMAAVNTDAVIADLQAQGYTSIEVKNGPSQVKVEAIRGTEQVEVVYDKDTGAVLKSEVGPVDTDEDADDGVSIRNEEDDFVDGDRNDSDDDEDDSDEDGDSDDDADSDDDRDDSSGRGRGRGRGGDDGDDD